MIDGIQFDIGSQELAAHLTKRVEHHNKRAEWYDQKAQVLSGGEFDEEARRKMSSNSNNSNPVEQMQAGVKRHRAKASLFGFMADHVVKNETYRLAESDLQRLELTLSEY